MTAERDALAGRIRTALGSAPSTAEKSMFGVLAFMVDGRMLVCAQRDGGMLVRIDPVQNAELVALPGVTQAEMSGRDMGRSWIVVERGAIETDSDLQVWIARAMEFDAAG